MKPSPRTSLTLLACAALCASHAPPHVRASAFPPPAGARQSAQKKPDAKADAKANAQAARARRETREAVAALKDAAELARGFDDVYESVRMQAAAADAAWPFDGQWARSVLRRAWDATNAPGAEDHVLGFGTSEDKREDALDALTTSRSYVVTVALKHDAALAEALMREFERGVEERAARQAEQGRAPQDGESRPAPYSPADAAAEPARRERTLSPAGWQRLTIAYALAREGDYKNAAEAFAPLVAGGPSFPVLKFILDLRARDAERADALYLRLLDATLADASAGANDVLLLSIPVASPDLRVSVAADGSTEFAPLRYESAEALRAASSLPARARLAFFQTAASLLLRQRAQADGEAAAVYFAAGRLLPFFEREAPQLAPALNARLASLAAELGESRREAIKAKMDVSSLTPKNPTDPLAYELEEVRGASGSAERDFARLVVVSEAARLTLWERARTLTEEMEGGEMRRAARLVMAIRQVTTVRRAYEDEGPDGFERAAAFVRAADVPPEVRALGLAQAAELAALAGARAGADSLLSEAAGLAAQSDDRTRRAHALAHVTLSAVRAGSARAWEVLPAFVRAAEETDDLHYGAMALEFEVGVDERKLSVYAPADPVSLEALFAAAARLDAARTFGEARGFKDEYLRASALVGAGRAALDSARAPKEKGGRAQRPAAR